MSRPVVRSIAAVVGAQALIELFRVMRAERMPRLAEVAPDTDLYVFRPSRGGGRALIKVLDSDKTQIRRVIGNVRQNQRIRRELEIMFDDVIDVAAEAVGGG